MNNMVPLNCPKWLRFRFQVHFISISPWGLLEKKLFYFIYLELVALALLCVLKETVKNKYLFIWEDYRHPGLTLLCNTENDMHANIKFA